MLIPGDASGLDANACCMTTQIVKTGREESTTIMSSIPHSKYPAQPRS